MAIDEFNNTDATSYQELSMKVEKQIDLFLVSHIPICFFILCFSTMLLYITLKKGFINKSRCIVLIAIEATLNTVRQCMLAVYAFVAIFVPSGKMPFHLCCGLLQPIIGFVAESSFICMFCIAADRLCAIAAPFCGQLLDTNMDQMDQATINMYSRWSQRKFPYFIGLFCLCLVINFIRLGDIFITAVNTSDEICVICHSTACNSNFVATLYSRINCMLYAITIALYLAFFIVYQWKLTKFKAKKQETQQNSQSHQQMKETTRIYSALVVLCLSYSFGLLANLFCMAIQWQWIFVNQSPEDFSKTTNSYLLTISLINLFYTPILFIFSSKYRAALKSNNQCWQCHLGLATEVQPEVAFINSQNLDRQSIILQRIKTHPTNEHEVNN